ncbi:hypothetical protein ACFYTQ_25430 [Nocardia sp. NPDC004068]|uniref:hypothetical protein n=1 Tax=Nocardia sp. NPDC004068 TaxID=3364303 RepID=UPI0036831833
MNSSAFRTTDSATVLTGLLGLAERAVALAGFLLVRGAATPAIDPRAGEPTRPGLYRDRDGDIWQKSPEGWRLCLQRGVAVDTMTTWEWNDGHVRDYAPFVPLPGIV